MKFGFDIPTRGSLATPEIITAIAQKGEMLGFSTAYVNDHIVVPQNIRSQYPYSKDGHWPGGEFDEAMDVLSILAFLASATSAVRLLTSVMVLPYRQPVVAAKMISTIDILSNGRVTIGCGAGWMEEEFLAVGAPPFAERGKSTDEYLEVFREIWTKNTPAYNGTYTQFSNISARPKPKQVPLPIWIGGESRPALRRTVKYGDGWYPIGYNPRFPIDTLTRFTKRLAILREEAEKLGRDPVTLALAYNSTWFKGVGDPVDVDGERRLFTGDLSDIASDILALGELGVSNIMFRFDRNTLSQTEDTMSSFADLFISA